MKTTTITIVLIAFALLFQNCKSTKQEVVNKNKVEDVVQQTTDNHEAVIDKEIEINNSVVEAKEEPIITIDEKSSENTTPKTTVPIVKENNPTKETPAPKKAETVVPKKDETVKEPVKKPTPEVDTKEVYSKPRGAAWKVPVADAKKVSKVKTDAGTVATGKEIWLKECKSCHGTKGLGDGTKAEKIDISCGNFSYSSFQSQTDGELYFKTTKGRKPMPSFEEKLDDTQRWQVITYIRTLKK